MKTYLASDLHWSHKNIIKFSPLTREKYKTVENMDERMILEWNEIVQPDDVVYFLGDFAFCNAEKATNIANRLNGKIHFIAGNHDFKTLKHQPFRDRMESVQDYLEIDYDGVKICMMHYPIFDHNRAGRGSIMLHGHRHGNPTGIPGRIMDVGMDSTGEIVISLDKIIHLMENIPPMNHHG